MFSATKNVSDGLRRYHMITKVTKEVPERIDANLIVKDRLDGVLFVWHKHVGESHFINRVVKAANLGRKQAISLKVLI
jgi:hypothetical protein